MANKTNITEVAAPVRDQMAYVCSPLRGDIEGNLQRAREYSHFAFDANEHWIPVAPHLLFTQFLNDDVEAERAAGIAMDMSLLAKSSILLVFGKPTSGMRAEIDFAKSVNMPIRYYDAEMNELLAEAA